MELSLSPTTFFCKNRFGNPRSPTKLYRIASIVDWVNYMTDLPKASVIRLAKQAGAERVGDDAATALVQQAENFIKKLTKDAIAMAAHAGRKTLKAEDIEAVPSPSV